MISDLPRWVFSGSLALLLAPGLYGQDAEPDSSDLVEEAMDRQREFERFRESRIPVVGNPGRTGCDERIGRICIWFGGEGETDFPPEPTETRLARMMSTPCRAEASANECRSP